MIEEEWDDKVTCRECIEQELANKTSSEILEKRLEEIQKGIKALGERQILFEVEQGRNYRQGIEIGNKINNLSHLKGEIKKQFKEQKLYIDEKQREVYACVLQTLKEIRMKKGKGKK